MKKMISKTVLVAVLGIALFSFTHKPGGEGFEIYLNNKVLLQQYGSDMDKVKELQLNQVTDADKLTIKYHHCGKVGKNRVISIRDGQDKTLREFRFPDASTPVAGMIMSIKDIIPVKKTNAILKLYYSSTELPNGRVLANIQSITTVAKP